MSSTELLRPSLAATYLVAPAVALDVDFDARWAAWVARGHAHEEMVRRRFRTFAPVLAVAAAILYAFLRS